MLDNKYIVQNVINAMLKTIIRRTEENYAIAVIGAIIKTLEMKYDFLKYIRIEKDIIHNEYVTISSQINNFNQKKICRFIEVLFQIIYNDLGEKAGFFFIKEVQNNADYNVILTLKEQGIDLELIEIQQQFLNRRKDKVKSSSIDEKGVDNKSLLGYCLENVDHWKFDVEKNECLVFNKNNEILDIININNIVYSYIEDHGENGITLNEKKLELSEKEYQLLRILYSSDVDASDVCFRLNLSEIELNQIIQKLLKYDMLHYISSDEVILTEFGINYLMKREKNIQI